MASREVRGMTLAFSKEASSSDVNYRLAWPTEQVDMLIEAMGREGINLNCPPGHNLNFRVFEPEGGLYWPLRCTTRKTGLYLKPVVSAGWVELARAVSLRPGDRIAFFRNPDPEVHAHFVFRVIDRAPVHPLKSN